MQGGIPRHAGTVDGRVSLPVVAADHAFAGDRVRSIRRSRNSILVDRSISRLIQINAVVGVESFIKRIQTDNDIVIQIGDLT
jgi:hypothetical protein